MESNRDKIKALVIGMLIESHEAMIKKVDKALNSGAIDTELWDEKHSPMIIPKCILTAVLIDESKQYEGKGTSFEKQIKSEVQNIGYYL